MGFPYLAPFKDWVKNVLEDREASYSVGGNTNSTANHLKMPWATLTSAAKVVQSSSLKSLDADARKLEFQNIIKQNLNTEIEVCSVNEMLISPFHPIFVFNRWTFPWTEFKIQKKYISSFYSIVLDRHDTVLINFIPVITLGHSLNSNSVTKHDYFGTEKVINDLKLVPGYDTGLIECKKIDSIRDPVTNIVIKINIIQVMLD